jgi:hypothetical protein
MNSFVISPLSPLSPFSQKMYLTDTPQLPYIPSNATVNIPVYPPGVYPGVPQVMIAPGVGTPGVAVIRPNLPLDPRLDLNLDEDTKQEITEYFYYKTLDKWLFGDFLKLLGYLKITANGQVDLIDRLSEFKDDGVKKETQQSVESKINFIEKHVIGPKDIHRILRKYVEITGAGWYQLTTSAHAPHIKDMIKKYLKNKLQLAIERTKQK